MIIRGRSVESGGVGGGGARKGAGWWGGGGGGEERFDLEAKYIFRQTRL